MNKTQPNKFLSLLSGFCSVCSTLLLVLIILVYLPLTLPRLAGYDIYKVISGSMEPIIPTHSVVYVKACASNTLLPGDVITFENDAALPVVHRVQQNNLLLQELATKGDANQQNDLFAVPYDKVLGKVALHLPLLGYAADLVETDTGRLYALSFVLGAALLQLAAALLRKLSS